MRKDIQDATVRLKPDAAYDGATPEVVRKGTVIVPRSDDAGRQDGRIPPGVAASMGLVPRLHEVGKDMAYLSRKEAAESGKSGDELYADFYQQHAKEPPAPAPQPGGRPVLTAEEKLRLLTDAGYTVTPDGRVIPPASHTMPPAAEDTVGQGRQAAKTAKPVKTAKASRRSTRAAATTVDTPVPGDGRAPSARAKRAPVRVIQAETGDDRADTLDGFYDELQGSGLGSDEVPRQPENGLRGSAGGLPEAPVPRVHGEPSEAPADTDGDAVFEVARRLARERDAAREAYEGLKLDFQELRQDYLTLLQREASANGEETEGLEQRNVELQEENDRLHNLRRDYAELAESYKVADFKLRQKTAEVELLRKSVSPVSEPSSDTVRVQLGAEQELFRIAGQRNDGEKWETALLGHLDFSRTMGECVLSVIDPKYAAELLAVMPHGPCRIVNGNGAGTACAYAGICDKIYGDPASADYITLFRFRVTGEGNASGS